MRWHLEQGDALALLRAMPDACIDAMVTDPPAGIGFMGKAWDGDKGGRKQWTAWLAEVMAEARRVLKPGAHGLVWALPRTSHWTGWALEDAGFEVRDRVAHLFGSGFPKSRNVSKDIDKLKGATRTVIGTYRAGGNAGVACADKGGTYGVGVGTAAAVTLERTVAGSPEGQQWDGWGTALKPACEDWWLVQVPFKGSIARNLLAHGTGALNVDGCRIATDWNEPDRPESWKRSGHTANPEAEKIAAPPGNGMVLHPLGRWPAHVTLDEEAAAELPEDVRRFFYVAKPSTKEKEAGCLDLPLRSAGELTDREEGSAGLNSPRAGAGRTAAGRHNHHPTVKGLELMRWLVRLITPPGGIVLDPFCGSGSTGCGALLEGRHFLGFDLDQDKDGNPAGYLDVARARLAHWEAQCVAG